MEIEKKRETSWKIQLKQADEYIQLTSIEIGGKVQNIKILLFNKDNSINIDTNKDEFLKILSLLSAFKDVIIGEESLILEDGLVKNKTKIEDIQKLNDEKDIIDQFPADDLSKKSLKDKNKEELNPEDWDPW
jgi:hypothetical protein